MLAWFGPMPLPSGSLVLVAFVVAGLVEASVTNALGTWSRVAEIEAHTAEPASPPTQPSGLTVRVDLVGQAPTHVNLTSPARAGTQLLIVDQADVSISRWDGAQCYPLVTSATSRGNLGSGRANLGSK